MVKVRGLLLDVDYITKNGKAILRLWCKREDGNIFIVYDSSFKPYFYVIPLGEITSKNLEEVEVDFRGQKVTPLKVEVEKRKDSGVWSDVYKIYARHPQHVPKLREYYSRFCDVREADIPFVFRYLIDRGLTPLEWIEVDGDIDNRKFLEINAQTIQKIEGDADIPLKVMAFDCEMLNEYGMPDPKKSPIILISVKMGDEEILLEADGDDDRRLIEEFLSLIQEKDPDIITGYNQDSFDWPYLRERARLHSIKLAVGRDGSEPRFTGGIRKVDLVGRLNIDLYSIVERDLDIKLKTLDNVAEYFGKKQGISDIKASDIYYLWTSGDREEVKRYSIQDAIHTYEIGKELLPIQYELTRMIGLPLDEVSRMGRGRQVEWLLIKESFRLEELVPARRGDHSSYEGAFVLEPQRELHEHVVCLDFASMYPSIMVAFNISPDTLTEDCDDCHVAPEVGHKFRKSPDGFFKRILIKLINGRKEIKERMKTLSPSDPEYRMLDIRQQILKILTNSFYGYTGWSEAKWYRQECAEATAAWGRDFIRRSMEVAKQNGFSVLYGDTDSLFVKKDDLDMDRLIKEVEKLIDNLAPILPVRLEIDEVYKTIFFTDKKRYAGLTQDERIIVKGLEVRRGDWCELAKRIQSEIIEIILKERSPERAAQVVQDVIQKIKNADVELEDLVIYKTLTKKISEYDSMQAHVRAAERARQMNLIYHVGSKIGFVVVKGHGTVSERAYPIEMFDEFRNGILKEKHSNQQYRIDLDYYIDHQILPVALRILGFFGYTKDKLKQKPEQMTLDFFS
jgi:DNA polymerase I